MGKRNKPRGFKKNYVCDIDRIHVLREFYWDLFHELNPFLKTRIKLHKVNPHHILESVLAQITGDLWGGITAEAIRNATTMFRLLDQERCAWCHLPIKETDDLVQAAAGNRLHRKCQQNAEEFLTLNLTFKHVGRSQ